MKKTIFALCSCCLLGNANAALSIKITNNVGFDNTSAAIVDNTGAVLAQNTGFVGIGTFGSLTTGQIQALNSAAMINSSFSLAGSTTMNLAPGFYEAAINNAADTTALAGRAIYTVIGNGSSVANSSQFLIYQHSTVNTTGNFNETPSLNGDANVANGAKATGSLVVGEHGNFQHDFGGGGSFDAYNLVVVPEPSSTALLGLGGVALLLRRRR